MAWSSDELLFYGGMAVLAVSAFLLVVSILLLVIKKQNLERYLEGQYGPRLERDGRLQTVSGKKRKGAA